MALIRPICGCRPDVADHRVHDVGRPVIRLGGIAILSLGRLQLGECLQTQWEQIEIAAILRGIGCGCGQDSALGSSPFFR